MRINKFLAQTTGMGRRVADEAIRQGRVSVNNSVAHLGQEINLDDTVTLDNRDIIDLRIIVGSQSELYPAKTVLPEGRIALATSRDEKPFAVYRIRSDNRGVLHKSSTTLDLRKAPSSPDRLTSATNSFSSLDVPSGTSPSDKTVFAGYNSPWERGILRKSSTPNVKYQTILLNKPVGYVCSRNGQGNQTIYNLLPANLHHLKPVGRLDKNSSGLLLLTNDGQLAYELTHPKFEKIKKYKIALNKDLGQADFQKITQQGVLLEDGLSTLALDLINNQRKEWKVTMQEGRNRQIRRTFEHLGYRVIKLHRTHFGPYKLGLLSSGNYQAAN